MDKRYEPKSIEEKWYARWLESNAFHGDSSRGGDPYCIVIPPPNVTGILHMGHALNNTIQDILVRWRRMQGRNVVWMPGTDHAGIATQNVVERALAKEGKSREDLGRDAFLERVWDWRREYGDTITTQLKRLGASCDWERERFTMDEGLSDAVAEVFIRLYDKGLIYRSNYIINWCPRCHTALSDEESEHEDLDGQLYYIRYPVADAGEGAPPHIVVATTRPETLLGDVAVAIHPDDERYAFLENCTLRLPILDRELVLIKDTHVNPEFGTGLVKVTPAHDPNDFEMGLRHELTPINVMDGDATMNEEAGPYAGMDRFECRKKILADLEAQGLIEKTDPHKHAVGHCYRCHTIVEPRISPQWFVKMKPLAEPAIEAVKSGRLTFTPARWTKVYLEWMENIRDWCISRQIWWGHRIPVFTCEGCEKQWASKETPTACPECDSDAIRQDEDVLDTWFSSWLWPFSTFGWPEENDDLKFYYPTNDLVTASEIIFFWVARMVMAGYEFMGDIPFERVYIHGTVRDDVGLKMSKSLGNSLDPLTIIDKYSADSLRFSMMQITATGQDVFVAEEKFEIGRNFGTKLWNASRFMTMNSGDAPEAHWIEAARGALPEFDPTLLSPDDHHILDQLYATIGACTENLEACRINDAALTLYEFVWHNFCDWYIEYARSVLNGDDAARRDTVQTIMHYVLGNALRLLHPMMPFITEELWHQMGYGKDDEFIMHAEWPTDPRGSIQGWELDPELVAYVEEKHELIRVGRTLRADFSVVPTKQVEFAIRPHDEGIGSRLEEDREQLAVFLKASQLVLDTAFEPSKATPSGVSRIGTVYMPLDGVIDIEEERERLKGKLDKLEQDLGRVNAKLENQSFVSKAPAEVVDQQRTRKAELVEERDKLQQLAEMLEA